VAPAPAGEDSAFVMSAAMDGMTEVELAELALDKSSNSSVRQFAKQMQTDHEKTNAELGAVAKRKSIALPDELDAGHEAAIAALKVRNGPNFDAAYAKQMVAAHAGAIALFKQAAQSTDPDVAAFASRKLPTLQHHKEMADKLARGLAHA
jgi:putative membrane protein